MSFTNLKSRRQDRNKLADQLENDGSNKGGYKADDRFWYPQLDAQKNGFAIIRFLPEPDGEEMPYVKIFSHGFKDKGGWLIENCPTTVGDSCPVCSANSELWNTGIKANKDEASRRKRQKHYYANVYIVQDSKNPENEGTVKLFKFGQKIFDKITCAVRPEFEDEQALNPFNLWKGDDDNMGGANFKLKIRKVDNNVNYDKSEFEELSDMLPTDDEMEAVWKQCHSLAAFVADDQFKSEDELEKRLQQVLGKKAPTATAEDLSEEESKPEPAKQAEPEAKKKEPEPMTDEERFMGEPQKDADSDEDEEMDSFFEGLDED